MGRILVAFALAASTAGPVLAQGAEVPGTPAKATVKKDALKADYWVSRDLNSVLTKVVTIKMR